MILYAIGAGINKDGVIRDCALKMILSDISFQRLTDETVMSVLEMQKKQIMKKDNLLNCNLSFCSKQDYDKLVKK